MDAHERVDVWSVRAPRWSRRLADAPEQVLATGNGPPRLPLSARGRRLRDIRSGLTSLGLEPDLAIWGVWRRRRVVAIGEAVLPVMNDDERHADGRDAWWIYDYRWADTKGTYVLYEADWDGCDLQFYTWGRRAQMVAERLRYLMQAHAPDR